jgi:fucose permease
MFKECLRPLFLFMICCMFLTAATENGTNQFITFLLESSGVHSILVLVWITGLMTVGRLFAGPVVHRVSPPGMLLISAVFSVIGLVFLSMAQGQMAFVAAFFYAVGVCYFWPTMLGFVSERLPKSGALGLAVMGGAGMLSASAALPVMGRIYDNGVAAATSAGITGEAAKLAAGASVLRWMALLPLILIVAFSALALNQKGKGVTKLDKA